MSQTRFADVCRLAVVLATLSFATGVTQLTARTSSPATAIIQTAQNSPAESKTREFNIKLFGKTLHLEINLGLLGLIIILALTVLLFTAIFLALIARRRTRQTKVVNRKLQEEIIQRQMAEDEVNKLNAVLELRVAERTTQLEVANTELEAFSYSVSHDLRAPLRHIDGFSQALLEDYAGKLDEVGKGYLQEVRNASQEMAQLIDDILQLARVTRSEMRREAVNLSEMARAVVTELQKDTGRTVAVNIEEGLSTQGDKRLLRIVLNNLLGNAWKYTSKREKAEIAVGQEQQDGHTVYFVRDNGAGFDMAYVNKLFGVFQRLHSADEFEGTGIGLATIQRIVQRHGGRVWAEGAVDKGATFYFSCQI